MLWGNPGSAVVVSVGPSNCRDHMCLHLLSDGGSIFKKEKEKEKKKWSDQRTCQSTERVIHVEQHAVEILEACTGAVCVG